MSLLTLLRPLLCKLKKKLLGLNKKIEGDGVESVGALLANVRADEPNERQVVEALHKAIKARWVRWTDKVVQCVIRRCCKMCTMEWR